MDALAESQISPDASQKQSPASQGSSTQAPPSPSTQTAQPKVFPPVFSNPTSHLSIIFHSKLILTLLGFLCLAFIPLGVYYYLQNQTPPLPQIQKNPVNFNLAPPSPLLTLSLESPTDKTVVVDGKIAVKGKTLPGASVTILSEDSENYVEADEKGNFESIIELAVGINTISITAYGENGEEENITVDVINDTQ